MSYQIMSGGICVGASSSLRGAFALLESEYVKAMNSAQQSQSTALFTLGLLDESNRLLAVRTNRRILARCTLQAWVGGRQQTLMQIGEPVEFDATNDVLNKDFDWLNKVKDNDNSSDCLKDGNVDHDGPFEIQVEESICEFFGVESISDITKAAFGDAKAWFKPKVPVTRTLQLTVNIQVRVNDESVDLEEVSSELDYHFKSTVPGVSVVGTEIIDQEWV